LQEHSRADLKKFETLQKDLEANYDRIYGAIRESKEDRHLLHKEMTDLINTADRESEASAKYARDTYLENMKQSLFLEDYPVKERMYAGLKYVKEGGNGDAKKKLLSLIRENRDMYEGIVTGKPELKLGAVSAGAEGCVA
jgi:hypothetical protein